MKQRKMQCQVFVDPWYGSERYISFDPAWVVEVEDRMFRLVWKRMHAITFIKFKDGSDALVDGHWAERILAAREQALADDAAEEQQGSEPSETDTQLAPGN